MLRPAFKEDPCAWAQAIAALDLEDIRMHMAEEANAGEEDKDEDEDEDDEDDEDDDEEDDDEDEDDDLPVDEEGYQKTPVRDPVAAGRLDTSNRVADTDPDTHAAPDVSSDRVPATDAEPEGSLDNVKTAPLGIQEIENLEDDAKGG
jgi:hypothetical protein